MSNSRTKCIVLVAFFVMGLVACETVYDPFGRPLDAPVGPGETPAGGNFSLITPQQEIELGQQVAAQIEQQQLVHPNAQLQAYVEGVGQRLAANASRQDAAYSFRVIDNPDTINAFTVPGGRMYVYTGLMRMAENEAELAAVMAHEIAHVELRHHASMITRQYGFDMITGIILGQNPDERARLVAGLVGAGVEARYSRDQERASDELGVQLLANAGYDPAAMMTVFQKMMAAGGGGRGLPIFASHPPTEERMQRLQALVQTFPASVRQNPVYRERYQETLSLIQ